MVLAVLSTIFCCLPLGIVAIIYASKVDNLYMAGDYAGALSASKSARNWALIGAIGGFLTSIIYLIIYGSTLAAGLGGAFNM